LSAQAAHRGAGLGEPAFGARHLLLDGAEVAVGARLRGIAQHPEAVGAGFDIPEVLAKIVNQVDQDGFRRGDLG
jgi:hypothetical protein